MTSRPAAPSLVLPAAALLLALALCSTPALGGAQSVHEASASLSPSAADSGALIHNKQLPPSDDEVDDDVDDFELLRRLQDYYDNKNNVGKRAYSYVSEFKRLPVYNFGLGKRSQSQLYGFGLGKRSRGGKTYSFGLGKRAEEYNDEYNNDGDGENEEENYDDMTPDEVEMMEKRNRLYSFGLGKRLKQYSFGLGKRGPAENGRLYSFGLGKRGRPSMYDFGLGKRADGGRLYSFGLGKRSSDFNQKSRFNFGLGKRSYDDADGDLDDEDISDDALEEAKRALGDHRFSFGLGKREISPAELRQVDEENNKNNNKAAAATVDNRVAAHPITKRSLHYGFGLGKRSRFNTENDPSVSFTSQDDMSRYVRRPYSFGLGKRVPMYGFGIGKRSER